MIPRPVYLKADTRFKKMMVKVEEEARKQEMSKRQAAEEAANRALLRDRRRTARKFQNVLTLLTRSTKEGKMLERQVVFSRVGRKMKKKLASEEVKGRMARLKERRRSLFCSCHQKTRRATKMSSVALQKRQRDVLQRQLLDLTLPTSSAKGGEADEESDGSSDAPTAVAWSGGHEKWWELEEN
jgi:hypothetical protein